MQLSIHCFKSKHDLNRKVEQVFKKGPKFKTPPRAAMRYSLSWKKQIGFFCGQHYEFFYILSLQFECFSKIALRKSTKSVRNNRRLYITLNNNHCGS